MHCIAEERVEHEMKDEMRLNIER